MLNIGDRVIYNPHKRLTGRITFIGACDYGSCKNGDQCVLVAPDNGGLSLNFHEDHLTRIEN